MRNCHRDPTANLAIAHVLRGERQERARENAGIRLAADARQAKPDVVRGRVSEAARLKRAVEKL
jgi:hypothetical protein